MSFIKKIEEDYNEDLISLKELEEMRNKYSDLNDNDKGILDKQNQTVSELEPRQQKSSNVELNHNATSSNKNSVKSSLKVASDGWIIAGFIFALLGGILGMAIASNYAFGNYNKSTKNLGWVMLVISIFSFTILKSI